MTDQTPSSPDLVPAHVRAACAQLGWSIVGQPRQHPEGTVYLCQDPTGAVEPYTERAILLEQARARQFMQIALQQAGADESLAREAAAVLSLSTASPPPSNGRGRVEKES